jgi:hypothetical protein
MENEQVLILTSAGRRRVKDHLLAAVQGAFGELAQAILLKGSLHKGDFIPYFSDLDIHVFIQSPAMQGPMTPKLSYCLEFQARFGDLDPEEFGVSQFQVYFLDPDNYPGNWTPPLPGTYEVLWGNYEPVMVPSWDVLSGNAHSFLQDIPRQLDNLMHRFIDKPNNQIAGLVRLLGVYLKPAAYETATLLGYDPVKIWTKPLPKILKIVEPVLDDNSWSLFYQGLQPWQEVRTQPDLLRKLFGIGVSGLEHLVQLYATSEWGKESLTR